MDIFSSPASNKFVIFLSFGSRKERGLQRTARVQTHTLQTDIIFLRHHPQTTRCENTPLLIVYNLDMAVQTEAFGGHKAK